MCEPATMIAIGTAVMSNLPTIAAVGSTVVGAIAADKQADAEDKATQIAYTNDQMQLNEQYKQQNDELNQQMSQRSREALAERGRLNAAFGEGGLVGNSMQRVLDQNEFNLGQDLATMEATRSNIKKQNQMQLQGAQATAQSRYNSTSRPSLLSTGLQIAGAASGWK